MDVTATEALLGEYQRLEAFCAAQGDGPGRTRTLGWDLEYTSPEALLAFIDQILIRRMNDFLPETDRPVILDCGANIGYTLLHYKRQFPNARITAFEPDPQFVPILRRNLARNGGDDVELVEAAAWTRDGRARWAMEAKDGSRLAADDDGAARVTEVATIDLARYLDRDIDLLKMDIEGAEFEVLPHIAPHLARVRNIIVECHLAQQGDYDAFARVLTTLSAAGFSISFNSFGPWRDLTRRHVPGPLHAAQYVAVSGWRAEHQCLSHEQTYLPYVGVEHYRASLARLSELETKNEALAQMLAALTNAPERCEVVPLVAPFRRERGHCWTWTLPPTVMRGDSPAAGDSPTLLLEDDRLLGPGHALHDDVRAHGHGRYSHWQSALYLSTSDNSDPNTNGRRYTAVCLRREP
jgi:FkbM family methyltransferase